MKNKKQTITDSEWLILLDELENINSESSTLTESQLNYLNELRDLIEESSNALELFAKLDVDRKWSELRSVASSKGLVITEEVENKTTPKDYSGKMWWLRLSLAASALLILSIGVYFYYQNYIQTEITTSLVDSDVRPGGNRATLTLTDGRMIDLSEKHQGIVVDNDDVLYNDGSLVVENELLDTNAVKQSTSFSKMLTLKTPKGGQYQLTLSDGTKVWLNAASTLKYPASFDSGVRRVELEGEAYFEVPPQRASVPNSKFIPFVIVSQGQQVMVQGTSFNISNYIGDAFVTTLVEGKVKVDFSTRDQQSVILKPNQQVVLENKHAIVREVIATDYTAWTKNLFVFNNSSLYAIMKQLERWYDVEIVFPSTFKDNYLYAEIPRDRMLSEILDNLARSETFTFEIKGRRVVVKQ